MTRAAVAVRATLAWAASAVGVGAGVGCIIPDAEIEIQQDFTNEQPVRIVEPIPLSERVHEDCVEALEDQIDVANPTGCPAIPDTLPTGFIAGGPFCVCPERDANPVQFFDVFVEDADIDADGRARDDVFGVLLLDMPATATDPAPYVAYENLLPPDTPAELFLSTEARPLERPDPHLKAWLLGDPEVDLCNDDDGRHLEAGFHELRVLVTDRQWYRPVLLDGNNVPIEDEDGEPQRGPAVVGIPDLPDGASYDSKAWVFECFDASNPPPDVQCTCGDVEP